MDFEAILLSCAYRYFETTKLVFRFVWQKLVRKSVSKIKNVTMMESVGRGEAQYVIVRKEYNDEKIHSGGIRWQKFGLNISILSLLTQ